MGKKAQRDEELKALSDQYSKLMAEVEEERSAIPLLRMSACALDSKYLDHLENKYKEPSFKDKASIAEKRKVALDTPKPWNKPRLEALAAYPAWEKHRPQMPPWGMK
eukprot:142059-Lingulodinium_polyedra.AAC.1